MTNVAWLASLLCAASACSAQTLTIGLYDYSNLSVEETVRVTETAGLAFANAGFNVVWLYCRGALASPPPQPCARSTRADEIVIRLQTSGPPSSDGGKTLHMGHAEVTSAGGNYASAFVPAVRAQAAEFGMPFDVLLGYVVAHETGHCLLGSGHSAGSLMRKAWKRADAEEMMQRRLHLTKEESRKAIAWLGSAQLQAKR